MHSEDELVDSVSPDTESMFYRNMALKVGVMGGAAHDHPVEHRDKARQLGVAVAVSKCITVTGACPGLPLAAAEGAKSAGGLVIGISPGLSLDEHVYKYESPTEHHDVLIFTGSGLMGREVVNIRTSDIVVIIGGSSGTLGELAIAYDEGKLIGVLNGTGGITTVIPDILAACNKETGARVVYNDDPDSLIEELLLVFRTEHFRRASCFCDGTPIRSNDVPAPGTERDPVCGMWIHPARAIAVRETEGKIFHFCSNGCAVRFDDEPQKYVANIATSAQDGIER